MTLIEFIVLPGVVLNYIFYMFVLVILTLFGCLKVDGSVKKAITNEEKIIALIRQKLVRPATTLDINTWVMRSESVGKSGQHYMRIGRTFVVLDSFILPEKMYGAHSASFIVPDQSLIPMGDPAHNTFYFKDGSCMGTGCK